MSFTEQEILQGIDGAKTSYDYGNTRMPEGFELYRGSDGRIKTYREKDEKRGF